MDNETPRPANVAHIVSLIRDSLPTEEEFVSVRFDAACFNRKTNSTQEEAIASQWRRKCRQNPRLFNGSKFRYAGLQWPASNTPTIQLGLTNYRDHIGTNCGGGAALLQQAGETVHGDRQAFLADPLGVGALVLTSDNRLVLVKRALWTGEYPGHVDRPGGHAEPDEVLQDGSDSEQDTLCDGRDEAVRREVFESIRREIRDELGVPMQHLSRAYLVGALRDEAMGGRPTLEFVIRCSLPCSEVQRLYDEGKHSEADESLGLIFFTKDELFGERAVFKVPDLSEVTHEIEPVSTNRTRSPVAEASCNVGAECAASATCVEDPERSGSEGCSVGAASVANGPTAIAPGGQASSTVQSSGLVSEEAPITGSTTMPQPGKLPANSARTSKPEKKRRRHRKDKRHATTNKPSVASNVQQSVTRNKESKSTTGLESVHGADQPDAEGQKAGRNHTSEVASAPVVITDNARSEPPAAEADSSVQNSTAASKSTAQTTAAAPVTGRSPPPPADGVIQPAPAIASQPEVTVSSSNDQIVVVQRDGVVLFQSEGEVTETTMPAPSSGKIETLAEVNNPNPEAAQATDETAEKTPEDLERQRKGKIWHQMTPACRAAIVLLKEMNLKGFVFRF